MEAEQTPLVEDNWSSRGLRSSSRECISMTEAVLDGSTAPSKLIVHGIDGSTFHIALADAVTVA